MCQKFKRLAALCGWVLPSQKDLIFIGIVCKQNSMAVYSSFQKDDCQDYVCETIRTYFLGVMARLSKMLINPILFQILLLDVMG